MTCKREILPIRSVPRARVCWNILQLSVSSWRTCILNQWKYKTHNWSNSLNQALAEIVTDLPFADFRLLVVTARTEKPLGNATWDVWVNRKQTVASVSWRDQPRSSGVSLHGKNKTSYHLDVCFWQTNLTGYWHSFSWELPDTGRKFRLLWEGSTHGVPHSLTFALRYTYTETKN